MTWEVAGLAQKHADSGASFAEVLGLEVTGAGRDISRIWVLFPGNCAAMVADPGQPTLKHITLG